MLVDYFYLMLGCVYEQKHTGVRLIGVANKSVCDVHRPCQIIQSILKEDFDGFIVLMSRSDA